MLSPSHPLQLVLGLGSWITWFAGIYGGLSLACAANPPAAERGPFTWINGAVWLSTLLLILILSYWAWRCWRHPKQNPEISSSARMVSMVGAGLHMVAAFSTLAVGATALMLPPCL